MPNNHVSRVSTDAKPNRTNLLIRRKSGVSLVKAVAIAAIIAACAIGVMAMLDGNRALTADEASRQALRAIVAAGVAIACAVLYAACSQINAWIDMELDRIRRTRQSKREQSLREARRHEIVQTAAEAVALELERHAGSAQNNAPVATHMPK